MDALVKVITSEFKNLSFQITSYFICNFSYHHTFPFDYATSETGAKLNLSKMFIDTMAFFGAAYDRKTAAPISVTSRKEKCSKG